MSCPKAKIQQVSAMCVVISNLEDLETEDILRTQL